MVPTHQQFDEVRVFEGIGERTGNTCDRSTVRRSKGVCKTVSELSRKVRNQGDGTFYLAVAAWPENTVRLVLTMKWITMG
jgi:hypothetical protein